ncbi:MAG: O-antigen ligase family protein [Actinomycetota bacterium]
MTSILGDAPTPEPILGPLPDLGAIFSDEVKPEVTADAATEPEPTAPEAPATGARELPDIVQKLHGAARIFLTAAVFVALVIFDPRTIDVFNIAKLTVLWVFGAIAGGLWLTATILDRNGRERPMTWVPRSWIVRLSLVVLAISLLATLLSSSQALSFFGLYRRFEGSLSLALYVGLFLLIVGLFRHRPAALRDLVSAVAAAAVVVSGYVVLQSLGIDFEDWQQVTGTSPDLPIGNLGNAALTGSFLGIALPFIVYLVSVPSSWARRLVWTAASAFVVAGLLLTQSRPGIVGGAVGILAMIVFAAKAAKPREQVAVIAAVLFALAVLPLFAPGVVGPRAPARLSVVQAASSDNRVHMWDAGWRMTLERPLLGWGPETYFGNYPTFRSAVEARQQGLSITDKPHNIFLGWSTATGFVGLLSYLALIGTALWLLGAGGRRLATPYRGLALTFGAGLAAYLAQGLYSIDVPPLALLGWVCLGGLAVLLEGGRRGDGAPGEPRSRDAQRGDVLTYCAVGVGVIALIVVGTRPLRADHSAWAAEQKAPQGWSVQTMRLYEKAAALNPFEAAYKGLGAFYLERVAGIRTAPFRGEEALLRAATLYEQALSLQPDNVYFMINASRVYARLGGVEPKYFAEADRWLGRALTIDPLDPQLHDLYADLLARWAPSAPRADRREISQRAETQTEIAKALRAGREVR